MDKLFKLLCYTNIVDSELIIVGFDPGTTVGVSAISMFSKKAICYSKRNLKPEDAIKKILSLGYPIAIATDKKKSPAAVKEMAVKLNLKLITPENDLTLKEKSELVKEFLKKSEDIIRIRNSHEHDSLAAAIFALKRLQSLITKLERSFSGLNDEQKRKLVIESFRNEIAIVNLKRILLRNEDEYKAAKTLSVQKRKRVKRTEAASEDNEILNELNHKINALEKKNWLLQKESLRLKKKIRNQKMLIQSYTKSARIRLRSENEKAIINERNDKLSDEVMLLIEILGSKSLFAIESRKGRAYYAAENDEGSTNKVGEVRTELKMLGITLIERKSAGMIKKSRLTSSKGEDILNSIIEDYRAARNPAGK
jgi:predicted RNase H-like nuclease (RuvC/YqgF family)